MYCVSTFLLVHGESYEYFSSWEMQCIASLLFLLGCSMNKGGKKMEIPFVVSPFVVVLVFSFVGFVAPGVEWLEGDVAVVLFGLDAAFGGCEC